MIVCGTGHRPDKLGGYDPLNDIRVGIRRQVRQHLIELKPTQVISGMALGFDQDLVAVCLSLKIPFIAAVPFKGQESQWPESAQQIYRELLAKAARVVYVCAPGYAVWKMQRRNEWMVDEVGADGVVLAAWDGSRGGTGNCVRYARNLDRKIVRIDPDAVASNL